MASYGFTCLLTISARPKQDKPTLLLFPQTPPLSPHYLTTSPKPQLLEEGLGRALVHKQYAAPGWVPRRTWQFTHLDIPRRSLCSTHHWCLHKRYRGTPHSRAPGPDGCGLLSDHPFPVRPVPDHHEVDADDDDTDADLQTIGRAGALPDVVDHMAVSAGVYWGLGVRCFEGGV